MNHTPAPDPDAPGSDDDSGETSVIPPDRQSPPPEHLARVARLVEQGLPAALRKDGTGLD